MARLIYSSIASVDGYIADQDGNFDWAAPDEEVHRFVNDLERPVGTYLLGRRMYEVMVYWENPALVAESPPVRFRGSDSSDPSEAVRAAHEDLLAELRAEGWHVVAPGARWYQARLRRDPNA